MLDKQHPMEVDKKVLDHCDHEGRRPQGGGEVRLGQLEKLFCRNLFSMKCTRLIRLFSVFCFLYM